MAVIGIDAGGSKIAALVLNQGEAVEKLRVPTDITSPESVVEGLVEISNRLRRKAEPRGFEVEAIGVGIAGYIDYQRGVVTFAPNLPLRDLPLRDLLSERCGLPVFVDNDANVAALAEAHFGAGQGAKYLVHLTLGTGVGGGIIMDGRVYRGALGSAAELGHMIIMENGPVCTCGGHGCLEALVSGWSIARRVEELTRKQAESPMVAEYLQNPGGFGAEDVARHAGDGEKFARSILAAAGRHLGVGIATLVNIFNPEAVTLSGGLMGAFPYMEMNMRLSIDKLAVPLSRRNVRVIPGILGNEGGQLGAALLPSQPL
ncbi:MAG: ROK family protein [Actinomycetota bacterium]|nr:ROK family protein [Actinomycetota bacterium]